MPPFPGDPELRNLFMVHSTRNGVPPEPEPEVSRETDERDSDPREESTTVEEQNDAPPPEAALEAAPLKRSHHKKRL